MFVSIENKFFHLRLLFVCLNNVFYLDLIIYFFYEAILSDICVICLLVRRVLEYIKEYLSIKCRKLFKKL